MTLWHLLIALCFFMPVGFALQTANSTGTGIIGYLYSVGIGLGVGALFAWTMWVVGRVIWTRIVASPPMQKNLYMITTLLGAIAWIATSGMCGEWASSLLLRMVH